MTPEHKLSNEIRLYCGERGWLCFHTNVGKFYDRNGNIVTTGLPVGWPDLMILTNDGKAMFIETKIHPRKPTSEQVERQKLLRSHGFVSETVYSLNEFIHLVEKSS